MELEFLKLEAGGRDALILDLTRRPLEASVAPAALARSALRRHTGVGAAALLLVWRDAERGLRVRAFAVTGREEEPTLNDLMCAGRYAIDSGLVSRTSTPAAGPARTVSLEALDSRSVMVDVGPPRGADGDELLERPGVRYARSVDVDGRDFTFTPLVIGPTHAVVFVPDFDLDIRSLSLAFRRSHLPPQTVPPVRDPAEVTYARVSSRSRISARTWRFSHGEVRSEGYAASAVAVASALHGFADRDTIVLSRGGEMYVTWADRSNRVYVTAPVRYVFTGTYSADER